MNWFGSIPLILNDILAFFCLGRAAEQSKASSVPVFWSIKCLSSKNYPLLGSILIELKQLQFQMETQVVFFGEIGGTKRMEFKERPEISASFSRPKNSDNSSSGSNCDNSSNSNGNNNSSKSSNSRSSDNGNNSSNNRNWTKRETGQQKKPLEWLKNWKDGEFFVRVGVTLFDPGVNFIKPFMCVRC